jgi:2,4-dienoyl-CoA reductase-like NADH-dependent reductase (Old Yellow Enzyme family)
MPTLFDPLKLGAYTLPNRILMAPLTRSRAGSERVPNKLMAQYYAQRTSAGLIVSEATSVTPMGVGYADTPGIWSDEQTEGWCGVTKAVHAKGGASSCSSGMSDVFPIRSSSMANCLWRPLRSSPPAR